MTNRLVAVAASTAVLAAGSLASAMFNAPGWVLLSLSTGAALAAVISLAFTLSSVAAVKSTVAAAEAVRRGNLAARAGGGGAPSGAPLLAAFNTMADSLAEAFSTAAQAHSRLMAAVNSSLDAIVAVDREGRITFANQAAARLFARDPDDLVGKPFAWILPDDRLVEALRASRSEEHRVSVVVEWPERRFLQADMTSILGGGDWRSLVVLHDLTDIKRVEQVRRDFVANVSHELRTPLAGIKAAIETLRSGAKDDPQVAGEFLARADSEVDRLVRMVEDLLELSRLESGDIPMARQNVDVGALLTHATERLRPQAERAGVSLTLEVQAEIPEVDGDADMIERAVVNLIHNALKFTPAGGSVHVRASAADGAMKVSVADTGIGILPDDLPRIFERFYKASRSRGAAGAGLGLAVARHAVEAHGGTISVESQPDQGSTFTVTIPTASGRRPGASSASP